jgi:hypothetical protein
MFWDYFIFLLIGLRKFVEKNRIFTMETDSDVRDLISTPIKHEYPDHVLYVQSLSLFSVT